MTIGIEHVNDYLLIRFEIRFERKFPIRRSLVLAPTQRVVRIATDRADKRLFLSVICMRRPISSELTVR